MRDAHGPFSTLLLTAPLLVVPTLAAIGLPGMDAASGRPGLTLGEAGDEDAADLFAEEGFDDAFAGGVDGRLGEAADELPPAAEGVRWAGGEPTQTFGDDPLFPGAVSTASGSSGDVAAESPIASLVPADPTRPTAARTAEADEVSAASVRLIIAQLEELGAERLDQEASGDQFYFGCTLASAAGPGGPKVDRRFEAEADTLAEAAGDVLAQVRRFRVATAGGAETGDLALAEPAR
ncbi:hypothetical protein [Alienimonas californiensis]|uniref:Uncharacterized protein n=1 Tax=Alienimonas californiensis TaxID=2527989 RepID=A0A517PEU5_9PLAN|nr:hypothetical protein [Alienimonas californiensis]QDT17885.1 hypothetical protein CA12_40210 [Alienimonas californiensis]